MADKWQAIHNFWSGFGIPAYDESSVPDDAQYPYITYSAAVGEFEQPVLLSASIWDRSTSWAWVSQKAIDIARAIGQNLLLKIDGGYLFITKGSPFAQRMQDEDDSIRRVYLNLQTEFFTNY